MTHHRPIVAFNVSTVAKPQLPTPPPLLLDISYHFLGWYSLLTLVNNTAAIVLGLRQVASSAISQASRSHWSAPVYRILRVNIGISNEHGEVRTSCDHLVYLQLRLQPCLRAEPHHQGIPLPLQPR